MNPNEQKNHKRVTDSLSERLDSYVEATDAHLSEMEEEFRAAVNAERTHRLKLAEEHQNYIDTAVREIRSNHASLGDFTVRFVGRGFWARLNWLVTGR